MMREWSKTKYSGALKNYTYPRDIECGDLLYFLKQVDGRKQIHLTDIIFHNNYPPAGYDMYIVCAFGEAIDEAFIRRLDADESRPNPILITSQLYDTINYQRVRVFHLEHLHTIRRFFNQTEYSKLSARTKTHGSLSRRNSLHKTIITAWLLNKFSNNLNYSFCNLLLNGDVSTINNFYPDLKLTDADTLTMDYLHNNPVLVPGEQWDTDNVVYRDSKLIWTMESMFLSKHNEPVAYLTEKIVKSIITGSAFIMVSQQHSYRRLADMGFKSVIELESDDKLDNERFAELFDLIDNYDFDDILSRPETQEIVDYNYNYFWGAFYSHIEYKNKDRIAEILDYINEN
jgi:hypothetical protein